MSAIISGRAVVTTGGTAVPLSAASVAIRLLVITAETDNTNPVAVGGSDVVGALATRKGVALAAGESLRLGLENGVDELSDVYIDAVTDTEGVTYLYVEA